VTYNIPLYISLNSIEKENKEEKKKSS